MSAASILFVGGVRSGKTGLAQRWAEARSPRRLYLATGRADDAEMAVRIARHKADRGPGWGCLEESFDPVAALRQACADRVEREAPGAVLLDCVSFWIASLMGLELQLEDILERVAGLAAFAANPPCPLALVSAETGLGMVAMSPAGRCFQDTLGTANQMLAQACHSVIFVSCGLPLVLKGTLPKELC